MSLVIDSLKFKMAILQIHCYFFVEKKCENPLHLPKDSYILYYILSTKNNSVRAYHIYQCFKSRMLAVAFED